MNAYRVTVAALAGVGLAAAAFGLGSSVGASARPVAATTTNVTFVAMSPPFKLFVGKAFAANASLAAAVIGGATKVPTNATTVDLWVTAGGKAAGSMTFYPTGNVPGGSGQSLSWTGGSSASAAIQENVGLADDVTFANGAAAASATASIIGYSTQVTDGDISPADGSTGEVLTNTGTGASWQRLLAANMSPVGGSSGQVLTNTGTGTAWQTTGQSYASATGGIGPLSPYGPTVVDSVAVPPGSYQVTDTLLAGDGAEPNLIQCYIVSPGGSAGEPGQVETDASIVRGNMTMQLNLTTTGGTIKAECIDSDGTSNIYDETLTATQVSGLHGVHGPS